jgi:hypothetical protein
MLQPAIVALIPTGKNGIVKVILVHEDTGEILHRKEYVMFDVYNESAIDCLITDVEQRFPVRISQVSLPTRGELE